MTEYRRNPTVEAAPMSGETVLYNPDTNQFCVLNETAAFIWEALEEPKTQRQLCDGLLAEFEGVDLEAAERDVEATLSQFKTMAIAVQA